MGIHCKNPLLDLGTLDAVEFSAFSFFAVWVYSIKKGSYFFFFFTF